MANVAIQLQFPDPPTILTQLEHVSGAPFSAGYHLVDRVRGPIGLDALGFAWLFTGTPVGIGRTVGQTVTTFEEYIAQVLEVKVDITNTTLNGEVYNLKQDEGRQFFSEFPIERIALWVAPGTTIDLYWILVL